MLDSRILIKAIVLSIIAAGALFGVLFLRSRYEPYIEVQGIRIPVSVAQSDTERSQGLSGTMSLSRGTGKLFIFDTADLYGFWMKDMRYALDIVWIDSSWSVVGVTRNVAPESYPSVFYPPSPVRYVLEMVAGDPVVDKLSIGTNVTFVQK